VEFQTCCKRAERDDAASAYVLAPSLTSLHLNLQGGRMRG